MPRYSRRYRKSADPRRDLAVSLVSLLATVVLFFGLIWLFSRPNAFNLPFNRTPTPVPLPQSPGSSISGLEWILIPSLIAVLIGGAGLIILGFIWLATRNSKSTRVTAPSPASLHTNPSTNLQSPSSVQPQAEINSDVESSPISSFSIAQAQEVEESEVGVEASSLMSGFERSFFWALSKTVQNDYYIFPQVYLRELLDHAQGLARDLRGMYNKGVVDFLLVNPTSLEAVLAFEFDDPSHRQADAQARDHRKEDFLQEAGIPLLRFRSGSKWNADSLRQQIEQSVVSHQAVAFLDDSECSSFRALRQARDDLYIFPKAPLKRIMRRKDWLSLDSYKALENESVDFLLAHPRYLGTMLVVDLDDSDCSDKADLLKQAEIRRLCLDCTAIPSAIELREKIAQATK